MSALASCGLYASREDLCQPYGVTPAELRELVETVIKENEKKTAQEKTQERRREQRAEKDQITAQREKAKAEAAAQKAKERADKEAAKEAERKQREREKAFEELAKLPRAEREPQLLELAKRRGEDVAALRDEFAEYAAIEEEKPWPEPVDTLALLTEIMTQLQRYVIVHNKDGAIAVVLWIVFAWLHRDIAVHSPLLVFDSAEGDTGKTTLCGFIKFTTPRAYTGAELTGPNLYRFVDNLHPTLIIDDADRLLERKPDLVHIINVSWTRGTKIPRQVKGETYFFDPFCPKVLAGVNIKLPKSTTATRAITVKLLPKLAHETVDEFSYTDNDEFKMLRRKLARWSADNIPALEQANPKRPEGFNNRVAMNCKLLLAIADLAGDKWPKLARKAVVNLARERNKPSEGRQLLTAFRDLFRKHGTELASKKVQEWLTADKTGEWADFRGRGRPITQREIALLVDLYDIHPDVIHPSGRKAERGYKAEWFVTAFRHYLKTPARNRTTVRKPRGKPRK
jgi:flagellar biosynthesis GTPase FlhF